MRLRNILGLIAHRRRRVAFSAMIDPWRGQIEIGDGLTMDRHSELSTRDGGSIKIGLACEIGAGTILRSSGGSIEIGDHCSFNPYCVVYGHGGLRIGNYVRVAGHSMIVPFNHRFDRLDVPIHEQGLTKKGIQIEDDVWIGAGVRILDGVTIGRGCVVAAGSVVVRSLPPFSICAGVPARVIRQRE